MSGIEIVLIVAAGIAIAHKVDERKKRKRAQAAQQQLLTHGTANIVPTPQSAEQAGSRTRRPNQQVPVEEEEALPLYSPPTKDLLGSDLPTYDEAGSQGSSNTTAQHFPPEKLGRSSSEVRELDSTTNPFADSSSESHLQPHGTTTITRLSSSASSHYEYQPPTGSPFDDNAATAVETVSSQPSSNSKDNSPAEKVKTSTSSKVKFWKRHSPTTSSATATAKASS